MNQDDTTAAIRAAFNRALNREEATTAPALPSYRRIVERMCATARRLLDTETELERRRRWGRRGHIAEDALAAVAELLASGVALERTPEVVALVNDLATLWRDEPPAPVYELCPIEPTGGLLDLPTTPRVDPWPHGRQPPG